MKQHFLLFGLLLMFAVMSPVQAQKGKKNIQLEQIWQNYEFAPKQVPGFNFLNDGIHYTQYVANEEKGWDLAIFNILTGQRTQTILTSPWGISQYTFSPDETKILFESEVEAIYRHSAQANYYIYDRTSKTTQALSLGGKQRYATFNPQGDKVAFVRNNNLFYKDLKTGQEVQITTDGKANEIINGATDWVYEEEFAIAQAFFWSPKGDYIAFLRFDESEVKEFRLTSYNNNLYPDESVFKYPKAGEKNAIVTVHIHNLAAQKTIPVQFENYEEQYIPRIEWSPNDELAILRMNRHQNKLDLIFANPQTGAGKIMIQETNPYFINIEENLLFLDNGNFVWLSERDGFKHLYLYEANATELRRLTKGNWEVTNVYGIDQKASKLYYQAAATKPTEREIYSISLLGGEPQMVSKEAGVNNATFTTTFEYFILSHSTALTPPTYVLYNANTGEKVRALEENKDLVERMKTYNTGTFKFFNFHNAENVTFNGWMITPPNFNPKKKYPVFMVCYGGPGRQMVMNQWLGMDWGWYHMLAQKGYIVVAVDGRGTDARGDVFSKATYMQLGKYEVEDQMAAAQYLSKLSYVDAKRIGIFGWSFGGYLSTLCISKGAEFFKMAIAVAPVIHWKWYDTIYTERYMRTPQENPEGYENNSPLNFAHLIKGNYLLIHGTGDDNVHAQNAFEMVRVLVEKNIPFEQAFYTNKNHGIYGGATRYHLYNKMTDFILKNL